MGEVWLNLGRSDRSSIVMNDLADVKYLITTDVQEVAPLSVGARSSLKSHFQVGDIGRREQAWPSG